jgi:hypothetical protein
MEPSRDDILALMEDWPPLVPVWPKVGKALGLTRHISYQMCRLGQLPTTKCGRLTRVITPALRQMLLTGEQPWRRRRAS